MLDLCLLASHVDAFYDQDYQSDVEQSMFKRRRSILGTIFSFMEKGVISMIMCLLVSPDIWILHGWYLNLFFFAFNRMFVCHSLSHIFLSMVLSTVEMGQCNWYCTVPAESQHLDTPGNWNMLDQGVLAGSGQYQLMPTHTGWYWSWFSHLMHGLCFLVKWLGII